MSGFGRSRGSKPDVETPISVIEQIKPLSKMNHNKVEKEKNAIISQIETGNFIHDEVNDEGDTPLMFAIKSGYDDIAEKLVNSGKVDLEHTNKYGYTALMHSILKGFIKPLAFAIIDSGKSNPGSVSRIKEKNTALLIALNNIKKISWPIELVKKLIDTGESNPGYVNADGMTALLIACDKGEFRIAQRIIETGESNPGYVNADGMTALLIACYKQKFDIAQKIIETGESNPGYVNADGMTALLIACYKEKFDIAHIILATSQSNPLYRHPSLGTALDICESNSSNNTGIKGKVIGILKRINKNKPKYAVEQLESLWTSRSFPNILTPSIPHSVINVNEDGFDFFGQNREIIDDYLKEHFANICIQIEGQNFLTNKQNILTLIDDDNNLKYGCKKAGYTGEITDDDNILFDKLYVNMSPIIGMQIVLSLDKVQSILSGDNQSKLFVIEKTDVSFPSIMSKHFYHNREISSDHCQPEKETYVYNLFTADSIRTKLVRSPDSETSQRKQAKLQEPENIIKIQYKGDTYSFVIDLDTANIGTIIDLLLQKLLDENTIKTKEIKRVRLIYKGIMIYDTTTDSEQGKLVKLNEINGFKYGDTIQSMISENFGGTRRKHQIRKGKTFKKSYKNLIFITSNESSRMVRLSRTI